MSNSIFASKTYSTESWKIYLDLNNSRHQIQLRAPERELVNYLDKINWDIPTYQIFQRFALLDKNEMNKQKMNDILNVTEKFTGIKWMFNHSFSKSIETYKIAFQPWTWILKLFLLNFFIFLILVCDFLDYFLISRSKKD